MKKYTYTVHADVGKNPSINTRIGWRKTAKGAAELAALCLKTNKHEGGYRWLTIVVTDREPGDFSY